ncbi:pleiotropic drug resistance ABC transporter [Coprinopsis sp. MPI-PUGE-AT-0042]|nr:pleiotropic drug resistance ABC transporter [Coprinopsis sp. MPI-PUGE-AT-0042]
MSSSTEASNKLEATRGKPRRHQSRVSVDYFDPEGARALAHTLSDESTRQRPVEQTRSSSQRSGSSTAQSLTIGENVDFEKLVRRYLERRDESGVKGRQLGVMFSDLRVVGMGASASFQPTLGSLFNPKNILRGLQLKRHPPLRDILAGFEGVVRPGEMLLVLGRPGSGCTSLLKVLANQRNSFHAVEGDVVYDSLTPDEVAARYRGDIQYCPEDDIHFPTLTVDQTIHFAAKTRAPQARISGQSRDQFTRTIADLYETIFGLKHVKDTVVGDESLRGVSGGEKKRVSISEVMATNSLITSWDNATRGLDSSTALEFIRALRIATDLARNTTIVSIYQAGESLADLFDKICLIYEGKMVYFGPARLARQYFIDMGYEPANRQTTPDFLVSVTDPKGRTTRDNRPEGSKPIPKTPLEFEQYYRDSEIRKMNLKDMEEYEREFVDKEEVADEYRKSAREEQARHTRGKSSYTISIPMQTRIVMLRRIQIMRGSFLAQGLKTFTFVAQAVIIGTTFLKLPDNTGAYFSRGGVLFFSTFLPALFSMSEIPALFAQRRIVHRHEQAAMYHPMIEALALTLVDIPFVFVTMVCFTVILYFVVQLEQTASSFFIYFVFIFAIAVSMKAFFRGLAASFKSEAPAQAVAGILLLALSIYTGYQIPRPSMIGALRWISYINPTFYAFEGLMANEFHALDGACASLVPSGPGYEGVSVANQVCPVVGGEAGQPTVNGDTYLMLSYGYMYNHLWRNFGIVIAFGIGFLCWLLIFSEYNTGVSGGRDITLFKRGTKPALVEEAEAAVGNDEEKEATANKSSNVADEGAGKEDAKDALAEQPKMENVFSWDHITYTVSVSGEKRVLLDDVSGYVAPGKLTALMGESGAGKTTLLNVLAERTDSGVITGDRFFNGQGLPPDFQSQTGYCQQMDTHAGKTTVREALQFSARLRQPSSVSKAEKDAYVEKCLKMCGLEPFADAMVGTLGVEQKKRTTIGVELAAKPKLLLFLDEPTSGLDSQSAWAIMAFLRTLADNAPQPSAELFQVFDRLLLLKKGGQVVFFGDTGHHSSNLIKYFESNGARKCKPEENPAEYMLDIIGAGAAATTDRDWNEVWTNSEESSRTKEELKKIHDDGRKNPPVAATLKSTFATPWIYQAAVVLQRSFRSYWRDPTYLMSKLTLNITSGLFIGFTFFKSKDTIQDSQNKLFVRLPDCFVGMGLTIIRCRLYLWRQLWYILVELPWNILGSTLFFCCWYWTVGFPSSRGGFTYLMYGVLFPCYYTTWALAVASLCPTAEIASLISRSCFPSLSYAVSSDGVVQPYRLLGWWQWMYHLSPYTYLIEAMVGQAVGRQPINCSSTELVTLEPPGGQTCGGYLNPYISRAGGYLTNPDASTGCLFCPSRTTDEWLGPTFNIFYERHWRDFGLFCAYIVFNVCGACIPFTYIARIRKHKHVSWVSHN